MSTKSSLNLDSLKSLKEEFSAPKKSNSDSLIKIQDTLFNGVQDLSESEFKELLVDITPTDRNKYLNQYRTLRKSEDTAVVRNNKRASELLRNKLIKAQLLKYDRYSKGLDIQSKEKLSIAQADLLNYMEGVPPNAKESEINQYVENYVNQRKQTELFGGDTVWGESYQGLTYAPKAIIKKRPRGVDPTENMTKRQIFNYQTFYKKVTGKQRPDSKSEEFKDFVWAVDNG